MRAEDQAIGAGSAGLRVHILLLAMASRGGRSCNGRNGGASGGGSCGVCGCGLVHGGGRRSCGSQYIRCMGSLGAMEGRRHGRGGGGVAVAVGGRACACGHCFTCGGRGRRVRTEGSRAGEGGLVHGGRCESCSSRLAQGLLRFRSGRPPSSHCGKPPLWAVCDVVPALPACLPLGPV